MGRPTGYDPNAMTTLRRRRNAGAAEGDERLAEEMMQDLLEDFEDPTPSVRSVGVTDCARGRWSPES